MWKERMSRILLPILSEKVVMLKISFHNHIA